MYNQTGTFMQYGSWNIVQLKINVDQLVGET